MPVEPHTGSDPDGSGPVGVHRGRRRSADAWPRPRRWPWVAAALALILVAGVLWRVVPAAVTCARLDTPIRYAIDPATGSSVLTPERDGAPAPAAEGFDRDRGALFAASAVPRDGLVAVHQLYRPASRDYAYTTSRAEIESASTLGYTDQGPAFWALVRPTGGCRLAVHRFQQGPRHQWEADLQARGLREESGWSDEGAKFYAADPPAEPDPLPAEGTPSAPGADDTTFTFAIMPDTQLEVLSSGDTRLADRSAWLAGQRDALDLRFVGHTGDVVNWDTPDHDQYEVARAGLRPLEDARIPYTLTIGNHDTQATGPGGDARDPSRTRQQQRDTRTFNRYFTAERYTHVEGAYEPGKVDNLYATYEAGGRQWLVLVLELWPRRGVVSWAQQVVESHPDHNVIVTTHSYLDGGPQIYQRADYGDSSPAYLFENLISRYPTIKFVFCGHAGIAASRVDRGVAGNKILTYEQTFHSRTTNPVRLVEVDTARGTVRTWIYAPSTGEEFPRYDDVQGEMEWR